MLDVFAFMFIKCRCFKAGSAGKSFCTETGSSEPPQLSSSYTPGSLYAIAEFYCSEFVSLLFLVEKDNAVMCRGARRAEQKTLWRVGEREKKKSKSGAFVRICACFGACHSVSPSSQEGRAGRWRGSFAASSLLAALDTREGNHRAGRDPKASSSSTACLPRMPSPRRRHGCCQQALAPQLH